MSKHVRISIKGIVQGVHYRVSAEREATKLDLKGFVRNEPDGSVYLEAEGDDDAVDFLITWCHVGPPHARVDAVDVQEGEIKNHKDFTVHRDV